MTFLHPSVLARRHWKPPPPDPRAQRIAIRNACTYAEAKRALNLCNGDAEKAEGLANCAAMTGASLGDMVSAFEHMRASKFPRMVSFPRELSCEWMQDEAEPCNESSGT